MAHDPTVDPTPEVVITSFGYLHGAPPEADITVDTRRYDPEDLVPALTRMIDALPVSPSGELTVAVGSDAGRKRSVEVANRLAGCLADAGYVASVVHLHVDEPFPQRVAEPVAASGGCLVDVAVRRLTAVAEALPGAMRTTLLQIVFFMCTSPAEETQSAVAAACGLGTTRIR